MKWNLNYINPKGDFSDFDIEILEEDREGKKQIRIIRNLKYIEKLDIFEEYGTEKQYERKNILKWAKQ